MMPFSTEWTSLPTFQNPRDNMFFRDETGPETPFSIFDSFKREGLNTYQDDQRGQGHGRFSIPHTSNMPNGLMVQYQTSYGSQITREWSECITGKHQTRRFS